MQGSDRIGKITSDENLADSVHSQHFAGKRSLPGFSQEINITHFFKGLLALRPCERSNQTGVELVWKEMNEYKEFHLQSEKFVNQKISSKFSFELQVKYIF